MRLIDADALQRRICGAKCGCEYEDCGMEGDCSFDHFIFHTPTFDPESLRPHGTWIPLGQYVDAPMVKNYKCSECTEWEHDCLNYCPNCGAKMKKDGEP